MKVVADSGPIIALSKLGSLDLLYQLYGVVYIPSMVYNEVVVRGSEYGYPDAHSAKLAIQRGHLTVVTVEDEYLPDEISSLPLDMGEKQLLHIAIRDEADLVLLDDVRAREEASIRGLTVRGTLGIIVQAYRVGQLQLSEVEMLIQFIITRDDIWIAEELCRGVLTALRREM